MSNSNNNKSSVPKSSKGSNSLIKNINSNIKKVPPEEFKFFFKRYHRNKNAKNLLIESDTDSTIGEIQENNYELNTIYIKNLNNLNNFLQKTNNLRGITLRGNKLLENISINKFNEFFKEYGKSIEKKLKKHVLNYFYPNNNRPKLMGQKMNLTPIPVKRNIYLKNEKEKKDYKNAERAAVILRRLEYTHGLGDKINKEDKIIFYLMKGAALIIEDWWIKIMNDKKKNDNYNTLMGKIKNIEQESDINNYKNKNNQVRKNRFIFNKKNYNNKQSDRLKNKNGKIQKKNKIEIIEINLDEEQQKDFKEFKDTKTEPRNNVPLNSNAIINNNTTKHKNLKQENDKKNLAKNILNNIYIKKSISAQNIFDNNRYEIKKDKSRDKEKNRYNNKEKQKKVKANPIQLIVSKSIIRENKKKDDKIINKNIINNDNKINNLNKSSNIINNDKIPITNKLNNLFIDNKRYEFKSTTSAKKINTSSVTKEKKGPLSNYYRGNSNINNLFYKEISDMSKTPSTSNIKDNNIIENKKHKNCKVKSQKKIVKEISENKPKHKKTSKTKIKNVFNKSGFIMDNNINLEIIDDNNNSNDKRNNKLQLNISNDNINNNNNFIQRENQNNNNIAMDDSNRNTKIKEQNLNNINDDNLKKNRSISVVSIIGYKLKDDFNNDFLNSNDINKFKSTNNEINNNNNNNNKNKIDEIDNNHKINENNLDEESNEINDNNIVNLSINNRSEKNKNDLINEVNPFKKIDINEKEEKLSSNKNEQSADNIVINNNNNILININESNRDSKVKEIKENNKKTNVIPKLKVNNNLNNYSSTEENNNKKEFSINELNNINMNNRESKNSNYNSQSNEEGSFKFNKNSFFFNNSNNALLVNIDNNSDYDETEIKRINLKKNYYARYTTNIIKININNDNFDIINKKKKNDKNNCLTDKNSNIDKKSQSKTTENMINKPKVSLSSRLEKEGPKIEYKIIKNNNKNKPFNAMDKTSFDDSVDEIISKHLMKVHNNNNDINKQRIDKAYNNAQLRKSENLKHNYNNINKFDNDNNIDKQINKKFKKSKSSDKFIIKNSIDINDE